MISKAHAAFGYVLISQSFADGEVYDAEVNNESNAILLYVKGTFLHKNATGTQSHDFFPGTVLFPKDYIIDTYKCTVVGEGLMFCLGSVANRGYLPKASKFFLAAGNSVTLPINTKLFHCEGQINVNGKELTDPTQLRSVSNPLNIQAATDCYGLIFE